MSLPLPIRIFDVNFKPGRSASSKDQDQQYIKWIHEGFVSKTHNVCTDGCLDKASIPPIGATMNAWLLEPYCISPQTYEYIEKHFSKFDNVFGHDLKRLGHLPNFWYSPSCMTFILPKDRKCYKVKTRQVSACFSSKCSSDGHKLRHRIFDKFKGMITFFGTINGNYVVNKVDSLRFFKYQVVVENEQTDGYYTEKLIDCFLTGTIPIYWGSAHLPFNEKGVIRFDDLQHLGTILEHLPPVDPAVILSNFELAKRYTNPERFIAKSLLKKDANC